MSNRSYEYNKDNVSFARELRTNMTKTEKTLWYDFLSLLPITVHRQKNIGNFIVDFYIPKHKIVIELDGLLHYEENHRDKDRERDAFLRDQGIRVLRYKNFDVTGDFSAVKKDILSTMNMDNPETYAFIEKRGKEKIEERKTRFYKKPGNY